MNKRRQFAASGVFLGIEAGGTHTVAAALEPATVSPSSAIGPSLRMEFGPANLRLVSDEQLTRRFREIAKAMPEPISIAIGMAGARTETDRQRIRNAAAKVWPDVPCCATNDLETALAAAESGRGQRAAAQARVLVLSGTGSCCFGRTKDGKTAKVGGWGHLLGDKGSGYEIGLRALKAVVYYYDRDGLWSPLGQRVLRVLQLNEPDDLIGWAQTAGKTEIAALAVEVFEAASKRDKIALDILTGAADSLARDAAACAGRLVKPKTAVEFVFAGSVLMKQARFAKQVRLLLREQWPKATVTHLTGESVWGAVELARRRFEEANVQRSTFPPSLGATARPRRNEVEAGNVQHSTVQGTKPETLDFGVWTSNSPTEQRNSRSMNLDKLALAEAVRLMLWEDEKIPAAILKEQKGIQQAIRAVVRAFQNGGRLFYVGAGSSGRLGVLDASECPPTFRASPEMVQGIIAGGQRALWEAVEGAEDDAGAGSRSIQFRAVGRRDVVVGIAASGRTPFVWGALEEAKRRGATTVLLCFNPHLKIPAECRPDVVIAPNVGPEILTGSTRLKAGTATKLVLNILTTLAMVRLGKVRGNLMIDVKASNTKLRDRAVRIVQELTGADYTTARTALEKAGWKIKTALGKLPVTPATGRPSRRRG